MIAKLPNLLQKGRSYYFSKTRNRTREYHWLGTTATDELVVMRKYNEWVSFYKTRSDDFSYLSNEWLKHRTREVDDGMLAQTTYSEYSRHLGPGSRLSIELGRKPMNQLTTPEIQAYVDRGKRYQANRELATLTQMLSWGVNRGMLKGNPAAGVKRNKEMPRERYVTNEEFALAFKVMPRPIQDLMMLSYLTGLRLGDVLSLKFEDARDDYLHAKEGKTSKRVRFMWTHTLRDIVESSRATGYGDYIVGKDGGKPFTTAYASRIFRERFPIGQPDWKLKDLRAKSATDREDPEMASYALGHGSQSLTDRHYLRNQKGRIAAPVDSELASLTE